jgi:ribosomal protein L37E
MSSVYCSECGSKHNVGAKFCSSCGNPMSTLGRQVYQNNAKIINNNTRRRDEDLDEDGLPTSFSRPSKLEYEIDSGMSNKYRAEDIFKSSRSNDEQRRPLKINDYKKLSKEEFLSQSLKECAPRPIQDIDEK